MLFKRLKNSQNSQPFHKTSVEPITAADVQVDKNTGVVTVTVIEDFSSVDLKNKTIAGAGG